MTRRPATTNPTRGEIWSVQFDPQVGQEIGKVRPALVINSNSVGRLPLRIVIPITDWKPRYGGFPWFVHLVPGVNYIHPAASIGLPHRLMYQSPRSRGGMPWV